MHKKQIFFSSQVKRNQIKLMKRQSNDKSEIERKECKMHRVEHNSDDYKDVV